MSNNHKSAKRKAIAVKDISREFKEEYAKRLKNVDDCLGVLEELLVAETVAQEEAGQENREYPIWSNSDFNNLYDSVNNFICREEKKFGSSDYRTELDRIDVKLDMLTAKIREEVDRRREEIEMENVGPKEAARSGEYHKLIVHVDVPVTYIGDVPYVER